MIIVLGNQKAGTTVIAALLAKYGGLSCILDIQPELRKRFFQQVLTGKMQFEEYLHIYKRVFQYEVVKDPNLTLLYPHLITVFSKAKYVYISRDPRDNIRSILDRFGTSGKAEDVNWGQKNIPGSWRYVMNNQWLGCPHDQYIEQLAWRWNRMTDTYLQNPNKMRLIRYEDFCEDKAMQIKQLAEDLGVKEKEDISDKVNVQYQGYGRNRDKSWDQFYSQENLQKIEEMCAEGMEKLGYLIQ